MNNDPAPTSGGRGVPSMRRCVLITLLLAGIAGCAPANREQLVKEVLSKDPEFAAVLEKQQELSSRIQTYERELTLKRSTVDKTIQQLRKDLAEAANQVRARTADVKQRMEPDRKRLELSLSITGEELGAKREQRVSLGRQIAQLKKSLKDPRVSFSADQIAEKEAKIEEMVRDAQRLDQEMAGLKEHIRLIKIKLLLIKF